jgi:hypothetical protein
LLESAPLTVRGRALQASNNYWTTYTQRLRDVSA